MQTKSTNLSRDLTKYTHSLFEIVNRLGTGKKNLISILTP